MSPKVSPEPRFGGQAVIEGVMIKGPGHAAVAMRAENGQIKIASRTVNNLSKPPYSWPMIRGLVVFGQTLGLGLWALDVSAKEAGGAEARESPWLMGATMAFAFAAGLALFFYLPLLLTQLARRFLFPALAHGLLFNLADGLIRMAIFVVYVVAIGWIPDIRRVFEYHGAEHKVVYAWEHEKRAAAEAARRYGTLHPRCGTAFLLTVMVVSILFFSLIPQKLPFMAKLAWRLVLLPVIAGISYEIIRFTGSPKGRNLAFLAAPGLWLQKLTTKEPDDDQLEVAAAALLEVLRLEGIEHAG